MNVKEIIIIEAAHDWATLFCIQTQKFYSIDLKTQWDQTTDDYMNELISIENMTFNELNKNYESEETPSFLEDQIKMWKEVKP